MGDEEAISIKDTAQAEKFSSTHLVDFELHS
jgi:hypothetical protein